MTPLEIVVSHPENFPPWFHEYLQENLRVYTTMEKMIMQLPVRHNHYGIDMIAGAVRWHSAVHEAGTEFKISNNATPYFARVFHFQHPNRRIFRMKLTRHEFKHGVETPPI